MERQRSLRWVSNRNCVPANAEQVRRRPLLSGRVVLAPLSRSSLREGGGGRRRGGRRRGGGGGEGRGGEGGGEGRGGRKEGRGGEGGGGEGGGEGRGGEGRGGEGEECPHLPCLATHMTYLTTSVCPCEAASSRGVAPTAFLLLISIN